MPHLRCVHWKEKSWRIIPVCSVARMKKLDSDGSWKEKIIFVMVKEICCKDLTCTNSNRE